MGIFTYIKQCGKTFLISFLIWLGLTIVFLVLDVAFDLSDKLSWFPVIALLLPIFCGIANIIIAIIKGTAYNRLTYGQGAAPVAAQGTEVSAPVYAPVEDTPKKQNIMDIIDQMEGHVFEQFCAELLKDYGYQDVHVTRGSGDQGVDIVAVKHGMRYAFQCKRYSSKLGNSAIQQVNTGKMIYSCMKAVVITNNYFTSGAKQAAKATGVELWDRDVLIDKIIRLQRKDSSHYQS